MPVVTRSRTAALRGLNPTPPNANRVDARTVVRETAVQGAAGNRRAARGRRAKTNGTQKPINSTEAGDSASTASHPGSKTIHRSEGKNKRHVSQSQDTSQTTSQTCGGLYVEPTIQQVATTSNAAGSSLQPLPTSPTKVNGAGATRPRKGRRTTTRRGPKVKAKTGRRCQQKKEPASAYDVRAGTKRRREGDGYYPETSDEDETESASATRPLRRIRRKTEKAAAADALSNDDVDEAVNWTRRNKGKAKAIDTPTTEEASTGSKRLRDEEDVDADDIRQVTLDPGPSRRTTRRTRRRLEKPAGDSSAKETSGKRRTRRNIAHARPPRVVSRASTPESRESEEPTSMPSPTPSIERREADEQLASEEARLGLLVEQGDVTPSFFPYHRAMRLPVENPMCMAGSSMLLSPLMLSEPLVPATASCPYADAASLGEPIVKVEAPPSPSLGLDIFPSPEGSDKENDPAGPQRVWPVKSEGIASHFYDLPIGPDADGNLVVAPEAGPDEYDEYEYDEYDEYESNPEDDDEYPFYSVVRHYPRRPFEPMDIIVSRASEHQESTEPEAAPSEDGGHTDREDVVSRHSATGEVSPETVQRESSPCPRNGDNGKDEDTDQSSGRSSPRQLPVEAPENLDDSRRTPSREVEELPEAPLSPSGTVIANDPDRDTVREHTLPSSPVAELERKSEAPSPAATRVGTSHRNNSVFEDSFVRSNAPSPSPFAQNRFLAGCPTPERHLSLPPCQCGNPARHFVVHSDGEASDFSFMGDDEDF